MRALGRPAIFSDALRFDPRGPLLAGVVDGLGLAVVDLVWLHEADADVMMVLIAPGEETSADGLCVLDAAEVLGELGLIFEGLEVAFGGGIVVGDVGPAV